MQKFVKLGKRGFTLVELMIVVAIIGVLAALAIYGVTRYVANAKTTEARTAVARIAKDATTAYARPKTDTSALNAANVLAVGGSAAISNTLCPTAAKIPDAVPAGQKVQSDPDAWADDPGWSCLQFAMTDPQMYQYEYTASATGFDAMGHGDLDGDGSEYSKFTMSGQIQDDKSLFVSPTLIESQPAE
jgi:type IV pilus assembly protein PilA